MQLAKWLEELKRYRKSSNTKKIKTQTNNDFGEMTLDEAIQYCYDVVNTNKVCGECAKEHLQLAKWLEELKGYRKSLNTEKIKVQTNNDCEQYCAHIIGYGFEFFGKTEKEVKEKAKDFLRRTKRGEFIPGVLPYDKFITIPSIGIKYVTGVKYCFISPDGEEEIKGPSQMAGQLNNVPLFNKMTDSIGNYVTMSSEDLLHSMFDTNAFLNAGISNPIGPFNANTNQFNNNIPTIRYAVNTEEKKPSTSTKVDSTDDSIQLPVLIEEITTTTSDNKVCKQYYSGYVYGLDMCRIVEDSISEVISKCNELVSKIDICDILVPIDWNLSEDPTIRILKHFSTKGRTFMLSYCTKKLI